MRHGNGLLDGNEQTARIGPPGTGPFERRAANLPAADEAALGSDVLGSRAYAEELADREAEVAATPIAEAAAAAAAEP